MGNVLGRPMDKQYACLLPYSKRKGPPCAPAQRTIDDIPIIQFDIGKKRKIRRFLKMMRARIRRARKLSHGTYYVKAITPMANPSNPKVHFTSEEMAKDPNRKGLNPNSGRGYHIVELSHSRESGVKVQLLFNDYNQYFEAFRSFKDGRWSSWYRFSDTELPAYFNAIDVGVPGSHFANATTVGGDSLDDIFGTLGSYPFEHVNKDDLKRALRSAIVLFSEALRLDLVFNIVVQRLQFHSEATELPPTAWAQINSWGNLGQFALRTASRDNGYVNLDRFFKFVLPYKILTFEELIVHSHSAVKVIQWKASLLLPGPNEPTHKQLAGRPGRPGGSGVWEDAETAFMPSPVVRQYETHNARRMAKIARRAARRIEHGGYSRPPHIVPNPPYDTAEAKRQARITRITAKRNEEMAVRKEITTSIKKGEEFCEISEESLQNLLDTIELELAAAAAGDVL